MTNEILTAERSLLREAKYCLSVHYKAFVKTASAKNFNDLEKAMLAYQSQKQLVSDLAAITSACSDNRIANLVY